MEIDRVRGLLRDASRIVVFTGAGVSAESGIPTFRDALTGHWARHEPERLATEAGFAADPPLVWRWYASRREAVRRCRPNAAHHAIARLQAAGGRTVVRAIVRAVVRAVVVTQNVDGLHARAGTPDPVELHGNIVRAKCFAGCGWHGDADALEAADPRVPPHCPACGAHARPDVVWFGEMLPVEAWNRAEAACRAADVCVVVGTSGLVHPAAGLPALARASGAAIVAIGPEATPLDAVADVVLRGRAGDLLPRLVDD